MFSTSMAATRHRHPDLTLRIFYLSFLPGLRFQRKLFFTNTAPCGS